MQEADLSLNFVTEPRYAQLLQPQSPCPAESEQGCPCEPVRKSLYAHRLGLYPDKQFCGVIGNNTCLALSHMPLFTHKKGRLIVSSQAFVSSLEVLYDTSAATVDCLPSKRCKQGRCHHLVPVSSGAPHTILQQSKAISRMDH